MPATNSVHQAMAWHQLENLWISQSQLLSVKVRADLCHSPYTNKLALMLEDIENHQTKVKKLKYY